MIQSLHTWIAALIGPLLDALCDNNTMMIYILLFLLTALIVFYLYHRVKYQTGQKMIGEIKGLIFVSLVPVFLITVYAIIIDLKCKSDLIRVKQTNERLSSELAETKSKVKEISAKLSTCKKNSNTANLLPDTPSKPLFSPNEFWLRDEETRVSVNSQVLVTYHHNYTDDSGELIVQAGNQKEKCPVKDSGDRFVFSFAAADYFLSVVNKDAQKKRVKLKIHRRMNMG